MLNFYYNKIIFDVLFSENSCFFIEEIGVEFKLKMNKIWFFFI